MASFKLNGEPQQVDGDPDMPLLWAIRDHIGLTGTKFGCGIAQCGACTVHINGNPTRSCQMRLRDIEGMDVTTIEGVAAKFGETLQQVWAEMDVPQCGYCQSGQIMSASALLAAIPKPTDEDIDTYMRGNLCRCATYQRIRAAIHETARRLEA